MAKLICLLRVKDGILFVNDWLKSIEKLVDEIVVVDNGSTDGTYEVLKLHDKVVLIEKTLGFNEGRDKILAYELARSRNPDWCIWLDIDEIFEDSLTRMKLEKMMKTKIYNKFVFRRFHHYTDKDHYLGDFKSIKEYSFPSREMWKENSKLYFKDVLIHNGGIQGVKRPFKISKTRIRHFADINIDYREKVYENYINVDPKRKDFYLMHKTELFDNNKKLLKWREYKKNKIHVLIQFCILNLLFYWLIFIRKLKK